MNWRSLIIDVKNIFKGLGRVALINTIRAKVKNQGTGFIYLNRNTSLHLAPSGVLRIENQAHFYFNEYWHQPDSFPGMLAVHGGGLMQVNGDFNIYSGARLVINENARLVLGSGYINHGLNLNCFESIAIGHDVAISENVTIRDSDNHEVKAAGYRSTLPITIGNHVWIGMNVTILKGVTIGDGAIIAAGAVVNKNIPARCLAGGVPARVLKENVEWS